MYERKGTELTPKIDLSTNTSNNNRYSSTSSSMNSASTNTNSSAQQSNNNSNPSNYSSVPADPENQNGNSGVKNQGQPVSDTNTGPGFKQGPGIQIGSEVIWSPGKHGTYMSFLLLLSGMIASIVAMSYAPSITKENFTNDCPSGYESSCQRTGVVLRFSFALVIIVSFFLKCDHVYLLFCYISHYLILY